MALARWTSVEPVVPQKDGGLRQGGRGPESVGGLSTLSDIPTPRGADADTVGPSSTDSHGEGDCGQGSSLPEDEPGPNGQARTPTRRDPPSPRITLGLVRIPREVSPSRTRGPSTSEPGSAGLSASQLAFLRGDPGPSAATASGAASASGFAPDGMAPDGAGTLDKCLRKCHLSKSPSETECLEPMIIIIIMLIIIGM